jgi:hypothetical protein
MVTRPVTGPAHRRRTTPGDLLLAPGLLEVVLALAVLAVLPWFGPATGPPRAAAEAYLRDLEGGNFHGGYARLCVGTQQEITEDRFTADARGRQPVVAHRIVRTSVDGRDRATVEADLTDATGGTERQIYTLRYERDAWKVCGDPNRVRAPVIR